MDLTVPSNFDYAPFTRQFGRDSRKRAKAIQGLDVNAGQNIVEQGRLLEEQRAAFGSLKEKKAKRGGDTWDAWVKAELGWMTGRGHANRVIKVYEKFGGVGEDEHADVGLTLMLELSSDSTPEHIRKQVVQMVAAGNAPTKNKVRQMKKEAAGDTRPTPTEAKERAIATGEVVVGSDDRFHTPMPEADVEAYTRRRDRTYETIDAINNLATLGVDPETWFNEADTHWLTDFTLGATEDAVAWLTKLAEAYRNQNKVIENGHEEGKAARHASA